MKTIYNIAIVIISLAFCLTMVQCSDDDGFPAEENLLATIQEAENIIATTEEGVEEGDYPPGSQEQLQIKIDWARFILSTAESNEAVEKANETLKADIEAYKTNKVKAGYPEYGMASNFDLGAISTYDVNDGFTIQYRARFKDLKGNNLFCAEDGTGGIIMRYAGNTVQAYVYGSGWVGGNVSYAFEAGKWYDLAMTYDGQTTKFYVDGIQRMSVTGGKADVRVKPDTKLKIGTHPTYDGRWFSGNIYKVSIWDHPKSVTEIEADRSKDFAGTETGLLAYWPMDLNLGLTILDKTGKRTAIGTQVTWVDVD